MKKKRTPHAPKKSLQLRRTFSEEFRRQRVHDIEQGLMSVTEVHRLYDVSIQTIYTWLHRYSTTCTHQHRQVVELKSEVHKTRVLLDRVAELERIVGQKQLEIDVLGKMLEDAEEQLGPEWKKKHCSPFSYSTAETAARGTK